MPKQGEPTYTHGKPFEAREIVCALIIGIAVILAVMAGYAIIHQPPKVCPAGTGWVPRMETCFPGAVQPLT